LILTELLCYSVAQSHRCAHRPSKGPDSAEPAIGTSLATRSSLMATKAPKGTPDVVMHYGWRDTPVADNPCKECSGYGTRVVCVERKETPHTVFHRTCPECKGTGHK
jgi:hypothetical protein